MWMPRDGWLAMEKGRLTLNVVRFGRRDSFDGLTFPGVGF